jgi:hypothetical protein
LMSANESAQGIATPGIFVSCPTVNPCTTLELLYIFFVTTKK